MIVLLDLQWIGFKKTASKFILQVKLQIGIKMKLGRIKLHSNQTSVDALMTNGKIGIKKNFKRNGRKKVNL
jgi:hypothetical protein